MQLICQPYASVYRLINKMEFRLFPFLVLLVWLSFVDMYIVHVRKILYIYTFSFQVKTWKVSDISVIQCRPEIAVLSTKQCFSCNYRYRFFDKTMPLSAYNTIIRTVNNCVHVSTNLLSLLQNLGMLFFAIVHPLFYTTG